MSNSDTTHASHNGTINGCLSNICLTESLSDVHFIFPGEFSIRIPAHKMILAIRSPVFKTMFYETPLQSDENVEIPDIYPAVFQNMLRYIYTDQLNLNDKTVIRMLYAAEKYQIMSLIFQCEDFLQRNLGINNACTIYNQAKVFSLNKLKDKALHFISKNAGDVFKSDDYLTISSEDMLDFLKLDSLCISEVTLFQSMLKWVDTNIRFPQFPLDDFTELVVPCGILSKDEQLHVFKAITMKSSLQAKHSLFRVQPRMKYSVSEIFVEKLIPSNLSNLAFSFGYGNRNETISLKASTKIRMVSLNIKPKYQGLVPSLPSSTIQCDVCGVTKETTFTHGRSCVINLNEDFTPNETFQMTISVKDQQKERENGFNFGPSYTFQTVQSRSGRNGLLDLFNKAGTEDFSDKWYDFKLASNNILSFCFKGAWLVDSLQIIELSM
ncbi:BTBD1_2 [Mytilus coruscus]|uniref:BTBD1_2 n=1 Tax=Mytilus coruscus TaxID=42192 RepID=A0A6J8AUT6_MYTCO|nr:BTBD1_2 [Mytilus coruscus]